MTARLKLLTAAGLGAAYLWVAAVAAHPQVDAEYAAHYLRKTAGCWMPRETRARAEAPPALVNIGRLGYPDACRYLRLNWHPIEDWGAWTRAGPAVLRLPWKPGASAAEIVLRGAPAPASSTRVRLVLNGRATTQEIPPGTSKSVIFPLPSSPDQHDPDMRLEPDGYLIIPGLPPASATRGVGVGLVAIHYLPALPDAETAAPASDTPAGTPGLAAHPPKPR